MGSVCGICRSSHDAINERLSSRHDTDNQAKLNPKCDTQCEDQKMDVTTTGRVSDIEHLRLKQKSGGVSFKRKIQSKLGRDWSLETDCTENYLDGYGSSQTDDLGSQDCHSSTDIHSATRLNVGLLKNISHYATVDDSHEAEVNINHKLGIDVDQVYSDTDDVVSIPDETNINVNYSSDEEVNISNCVIDEVEGGYTISNRKSFLSPPCPQKSSEIETNLVKKPSERSISSIIISPFGAVIEFPTPRTSLSVETTSLYEILPMVVGDIMYGRGQRDVAIRDYLNIIKSYRNSLQEYIMIVLHGKKDAQKSKTLADSLVLNTDGDDSDIRDMHNKLEGTLEEKLTKGIEELERRFASRLYHLSPKAHEGDINEALVDHVIGIKHLKVLLEKEELRSSCEDNEVIASSRFDNEARAMNECISGKRTQKNSIIPDCGTKKYLNNIRTRDKNFNASSVSKDYENEIDQMNADNGGTGGFVMVLDAYNSTTNLSNTNKSEIKILKNINSVENTDSVEDRENKSAIDSETKCKARDVGIAGIQDDSNITGNTMGIVNYISNDAINCDISRDLSKQVTEEDWYECVNFSSLEKHEISNYPNGNECEKNQTGAAKTKYKTNMLHSYEVTSKGDISQEGVAIVGGNHVKDERLQSDLLNTLHKWLSSAESDIGSEVVLGAMWKRLREKEILDPETGNGVTMATSQYNSRTQYIIDTNDYVTSTEKELIEIDDAFVRLYSKRGKVTPSFKKCVQDHVVRQDILILLLETNRMKQLRMINDSVHWPINVDTEIIYSELQTLKRDMLCLKSTEKTAIEKVLKRSRNHVVKNLLEREHVRIEAHSKRAADASYEIESIQEDVNFVTTVIKLVEREELTKSELGCKLVDHWLKHRRKRTRYKTQRTEMSETPIDLNLELHNKLIGTKWLRKSTEHVYTQSRQSDFSQDTLTRLIAVYRKKKLKDSNSTVVKQVIASDHSSLNSLVANLITDCVTDLDIVKIFYDWLTSQDLVTYINKRDCDVVDSPSWYLHQICTSVVTFADLFNNMCRIAGVDCSVIQGHVMSQTYKPGDDIFTDDNKHSWNIVTVDSIYRLIDTESGAIPLKHYKDHYYLCKPEVFIMSHIPNDCAWQLLKAPRSLEIFQNGIKTWPVFFSKHLLPLNYTGIISTDTGVVTVEFVLFEYFLSGIIEYDRSHSLPDSESLLYCVEQLVIRDDKREVFRLYLPAVGSYYFTVLIRDDGEGLDIPACQYNIVFTNSSEKEDRL